MAMTLSKVKAKTVEEVLDWDGENVPFGYHPGAVTPALLEAVQAAAEKGDLQVIGTMLEPILAWWDVLDDDGERLPTDAATIQTIPLGFLMAIMEKTQEAMRPPDKRG